MSNTIASTILEQLGGNRFVAMTGAKSFTGHDDALSFRLPGGGGFTKNGVNYVKITLNAGDLYDIEFSRVRGRKLTVIATASDLYAVSLREVFTRVTGLATSLGTMGAR